MKKTLAILLCLVMAVSLFPITAAAEGMPTFRVISTEGDPGETVNVDIEIENNPGICGLTIYYSFDKTRLELVTGYNEYMDEDGVLFEPGSAFDRGSTWFVNEKAIMWARTKDKSDNGTFVTIQFKVLDGAEAGDALIELTLDEITNADMETVEFTAVNGKVTVNAPQAETYAVTVEEAANGSVTADKTEAAAGELVTLTPVPAAGYALTAITAKDADGAEIALTSAEDGSYTFIMPASAVTVKPTFSLEEGYYLIGINGWSVDNLTPAYRFEPNQGADGEYMLNITLNEGDEFKAVRVVNGAIAEWIPSDGGNYVVRGVSGNVTVYFRPEYYSNWNGHFWIAVPAPEQPAAELYGANVNLRGRIGLSFFVILPEEFEDLEGAYALITDGSREIKTLFSEASTRTVGEDKLYQFTVDFAAKEMEKQATLRLFKADGTELGLANKVGAETPQDFTGTGFSYSVKQYIEESKEYFASDTKLVALLNAMSAYGTLAKNWFDRTDDPVEEDLSDVTAAKLEKYRAQVTEGTAAGLTFVGSTLVLDADTTLRCYFTVEEGEDIASFTFKVGKKTLEPTRDANGKYYVDLASVVAKDLEKMYTLTVTKDGVKALTVKCSGLSYAYSVLNGGSSDPKLQDLAKGLFRYNEKADAYFG